MFGIKFNKTELITLALTLAVVIGSFSSRTATENFFYYGSYYFFIGLIFLWAKSLSLNIQNVPDIKKILIERRRELSISFLLCVLLALSVQANMRVQADEGLITSHSLALFQLKESVVFQGMLNQNEISSFYQKGLPIRPQLLAFLGSILHSLRGYTVENLYLVNLGAAFLFFYILCRIFHKANSTFLMLSACLLVMAQPLFVLSYRSAGLEPLFITLLLLNFYMAISYLQSKEKKYFVFYLLSFVSCLHTRYEALVPLSVIALFIIWKSRSTLKPLAREHFQFILMILLCSLPYIWQRILSKGELSTNFSTYSGGIKTALYGAFDPFYIFPNMISFAYACCVPNPSMQVYSHWISFGLVVFMFAYFVFLKKKTKVSPLMKIGIYAVMAHTLLMFFYIAGEASYPVYSRLFLPIFILGSISLTFFLNQFFSEKITLFVAIALYIFHAGEAQKNTYTLAGLLNKTELFVRDVYKEKGFNNDDLLIASSSTPYIARNMSVFASSMLINNTQVVIDLLKSKAIRSLLLIEVNQGDAQSSPPLQIPEHIPLRAELVAMEEIGIKKQARLWKLIPKEPAD